MKTFRKILENVKTADRKPEIYTKPDGKKGVRMVPMDKEVIKQEKTLEWLKASLAREAKKVTPRQDDVEEAYENTMYCKKCGCERGNPDPDCSCKMENATLTDAQCYSEQSKCGSLRKEGVNELTIADVQKATAMAKKRQEKEREAGKKSVSTADLGARVPKKEATIPDGQTAMTKTPAMKDKDKKTMGKIADLLKRANEMKDSGWKKPSVPRKDKFGNVVKDKNVAKNLARKAMKKANEDVKATNEISQRTKASYVKKATAQNKSAQKAYDKEVRDPKNYFAADDTPSMKKNKTTMLKRGDGIARAKGKDAKTRNVYPESVATNEISKGMAGRYLKKVPSSAAHGGDQAGTGGMGQVGASPDVKKGYEKQRKAGIKTFMKRQTGTNMAVNKLTGKAKVPAREGMAQGIVKQKISREKDMDAKRHDRMMDRARTSDTKKKNMSEQ